MRFYTLPLCFLSVNAAEGRQVQRSAILTVDVQFYVIRHGSYGFQQRVLFIETRMIMRIVICIIRSEGYFANGVFQVNFLAVFLLLMLPERNRPYRINKTHLDHCTYNFNTLTSYNLLTDFSINICRYFVNILI